LKISLKAKLESKPAGTHELLLAAALSRTGIPELRDLQKIAHNHIGAFGGLSTNEI
jgi:hypothetical protein